MEGQYLDGYKFILGPRHQPKGRATNTHYDMFACQLVADDEANPSTLQT